MHPFDFAAVWPVLAAAAALGGLVRGFTGFGFAMVFMPLAAQAVPPAAALAIIFFIDLPFALVLGARASRRAEMPQVLTLLGIASLTFPLGLFLLTTLDPATTRWIISGLIFAAVLALASGWRYYGRPGLPLTLGVGATSGLFGGLASLSGMPLALFWLSSQTKAPADMRADMQAYFGLSTLVSLVILWWSGLLTREALIAGICLMPVYGAMMLIGSRGFKLASEALFRRIAYGVILIAAILSLPLLDGVIR